MLASHCHSVITSHLHLHTLSHTPIHLFALTHSPTPPRSYLNSVSRWLSHLLAHTSHLSSKPSLPVSHSGCLRPDRHVVRHSLCPARIASSAGGRPHWRRNELQLERYVYMCMHTCMLYVYMCMHTCMRYVFNRDLSAMFADHAACGRDGDRAHSAEHNLVLGQCPSNQSLSAK